MNVFFGGNNLFWKSVKKYYPKTQNIFNNSDQILVPKIFIKIRQKLFLVYLSIVLLFGRRKLQIPVDLNLFQFGLRLIIKKVSNYVNILILCLHPFSNPSSNIRIFFQKYFIEMLPTRCQLHLYFILYLLLTTCFAPQYHSRFFFTSSFIAVTVSLDQIERIYRIIFKHLLIIFINRIQNSCLQLDFFPFCIGSQWL